MTDPSSDDKINFKIEFIGPRKKNNLLVKIIKEKIDDIEKSLG